MNRIFLIIVLTAVLFAGWKQFTFQPATNIASPMEALSTAMVESSTGAVELAIDELILPELGHIAWLLGQ